MNERRIIIPGVLLTNNKFQIEMRDFNNSNCIKENVPNNNKSKY